MHKLNVLLILSLVGSIQMNLTKLSLPKTDIVHTASGLILHYLSEYVPANNIVSFTVSIPMVTDMCYLIPIAAKKKIPQCSPQADNRDTSKKLNGAQIYNRYLQNTATLFRRRRFITDIISIGIGSAALSLSAVNTVQISNLRTEVQNMASALNSFSQTADTHSSQIRHLSEGQLKIANELNYTQAALNRTIDLVNEHADVIKTHANAMKALTLTAIFFNNRLSSFIHAVETHFIHTSIENILSNKLNLQFIHHKDMPQVIELIIQATNVSLDEAALSLSPIELITNLLVRQTIDFIPKNNSQSTNEGEAIGYLVFSSFFAAPSPSQRPFTLYELIPMPFNHQQQRVQLAQMPSVIGIEPNTLQFIRWSKTEAETCHFNAMSSCRETPAIRKDLTDDCLYQILMDAPLEACRVEPNAEQVFVHRVGKHWAISTNKSTRCHPVEISNTETQKMTKNEEIILPPVALITTVDTTSLACDHFFLPALPLQIGSSISIIENMTMDPIAANLIDLHSRISNNSHWAKLPYIPSNMQAIIDFISLTSTERNNHLNWHAQSNHPATWISIFVLVMITMILIHYLYRKKNPKQSNMNVSLPPLHELKEFVNSK